MSFQVTTHFVNEYKANVQLLIQHRGSKLGDTVSQGSYTGEGARVVEQVGVVPVTRNLARHADTPIANTPSSARWCYPTDMTTSDLIDTIDKVRMLTDVQSPYAQSQALALGRGKDELIAISAAVAARTGKDGSSSSSLPGGSTIGVNVGGTGSNLNFAKLRAAKRVLMSNGVDVEREELYVVATASDLDSLMNEIQVADFGSFGGTASPVYRDGVISKFYGFTFKHLEFTLAAQYPVASVDGNGLVSGSNRLLPVYAKSALHWGTWNDLNTKIDVRPDKNYSTQVWSQLIGGATRIDESGVVLITTTG